MVAGIAAAAVAVVVVALTGWGTAQAETSRSRFQSGIDDLHRHGIVGVQGVVRDGVRTERARSGVADLHTGGKVSYDSYFRMGSNTKTFVATVALQLVGEGKLSLQDTVDHWLPGVVHGRGNDGKKVTVRELLQHTSGLPEYSDDFAALTSVPGYRQHRFDHVSAAAMVAAAMRHKPDFRPGTSWNYSNTNYILIGMIIERVTGQPWSAEVQQRILNPLHLRHTFAPEDWPYLPRPYAHQYQQYAIGGPLLDTTIMNMTLAGAAGELVTTSSDLARFWQALQGGKVLAPRQMAEMHHTVLAVTEQEFLPGLRYGLGIMWLPSRCGGYWFHDGDVLGGATRNGVSNDGRRAVVISENTESADNTTLIDNLLRINRLVTKELCRTN